MCLKGARELREREEGRGLQQMERRSDVRRNEWRGRGGGTLYFLLSRDCLPVEAGVLPLGRLFTRPLFLHRIKETICLINAGVFNLPGLFESMHKCPHHYNRGIDLLRSPLRAAEM